MYEHSEEVWIQLYINLSRYIEFAGVNVRRAQRPGGTVGARHRPHPGTG